ncbi:MULTISPECIES: protein phosphatase 2C domain-containing protein [unclassified Streptomyces]|uniref:protein phosphatase 2C domain-containing protein n=1 Tax=unclassified Streptomyces TaxID=2593676 RepID=UPI0037B77F10
MSQSHQQPALSKCPGCEEPLDSGDRFCGACGYDLSAVPARPDDRPTMAITVPPAAPAADPVQWPAASETDSSDVPAPVHHPADLPGTDSGGRPLAEPAPGQEPRSEPEHGQGQEPRSVPEHGQEAVSEQGAASRPEPGPVGGPESASVPVRHDDRAGAADSGDFALAAPDPRTAEHAAAPAAASAPGAKVCVACRSGRVDPDGYCENCGHAQPRERDHMEQELDSVAAVSDRGLRHHRNEDSFAVSSTALPDGSPAVVAIVCDGVSSASRPDEASAAAASAANEALLESLPRGTHPQQAMREAIVAASEAVNVLAQEPAGAMEHDAHCHQNAPACTLVGAIMAGGLLIVGWVGDSRVYWVPEDRTQPTARLTEDDSWAAQMVAAGLMNEAEAYADERAHAITGWLGADAYELEPHTAAFKPDRPGLVVVCTDGLWNYAESAEEMAAAVPADAQERPLHGAQVLVGHALDGGGHDNVTVALLPFAVPSPGAGSACDTV